MNRQDVLIIGAGPSGLFAAAELARHGVAARLVERDLQPHRQSRATAVHPGTLEMLESAGVLQAFIDASVLVRRSGLYGPDMAEFGSGSYDGIDSRILFHCSLPQYETERILSEHLASLGGRIERGVTATAMALDGDAPVVELRHADGRSETVRPRFVIGAGGAHSVTRHAMDAPLDGLTYRGRFLVADIALDWAYPRGEAGCVCTPNGLLLLAPLPGGRWITFQELEEDATALTPADVADRVQHRLGANRRPTDVGWFAPFQMHRRIASRLTDGRRFLIGDAAHLSSAFGGEGLNAGLHDGHDLAWKLALVLHGHAGEALLDGYMAERLIADRHVLEISDRTHRSIMNAAQAVRQGHEVVAAVADPLAAAMHADATAMIDVDYAGSPLVADHAEGAAREARPRPGQRYPDWVNFSGTAHRALVFGPLADAAPLAALARRWSGLLDVVRDPDVDPARAGVPAGGVVLVRPDGHVGFRFPSTGAAAFEALDAHLASYLIAGPAQDAR